MTIAIAVCAVLLIAAVAMSLKGIFNGIFGGSGFTYANEAKYTVGDAVLDGAVRNLDIGWINGEVNFEYHKGNTVELSETSRKTISEDMRMRWWLDGDTLRVRYAKSGFRLSGWDQEKTLTVTLPEGTAFGAVDIDVTSGNVNIPSLQADTLDVDATSGTLTAAAEAGTVKVGTTSGDISLKLTGETDSVTAEVTSGDISVEAEQAGTVRASATSGRISVASPQIRDCETDSTSGDVNLAVGVSERVKITGTSAKVDAALDEFVSLEIDVTSGDVTLSLPEEPGFTADIDTASGKIDYSVPLAREGDDYVCGDGSGKVTIETTSGDVRLNAKES